MREIYCISVNKLIDFVDHAKDLVIKEITTKKMYKQFNLAIIPFVLLWEFT